MKSFYYIMLVFLISISNFLSNQNVTEKALNSNFVLEEKMSQNELTKISGVPLIQQYPLLPNGCEAVSATMILQYYGFDITAQEFVDEYLFMQPLYYENNILCGPDPSHAYAGNPYTVTDGLGCYAPVIVQGLKDASDDTWKVEDISGTALSDLEAWLEKDIPVILWATLDMKDIEYYISLYSNGQYFEYPAQEHCLVLVGMDDTHCYFNDPLYEKEISYDRKQVEKCYESLHRQAVVMYHKVS